MKFVLITVITIIIFIYIVHHHIFENFDMTGMGGRQFWDGVENMDTLHKIL